MTKKLNCLQPCFQTFPFPENHQLASLENVSKAFYEKRFEILKRRNVGLTKFYNSFHQNEGDELNEIRTLFEQLNKTILELYNWHKDSEKWGLAIDLTHDFYEVEYLPENDNIRYTISPEARKEVLKRLLLLNHKRYEEEIRQGLHKEKDVIAFYQQKDREVPEEVQALFTKTRKKVTVRKKEKSSTVSACLFSAESPPKGIEVSLYARVKLYNLTDDKEEQVVIVNDLKTVQLVMGYEPIALNTQLSMSMLNRKAGATFQLDGKTYKIMEVT